MIKRSLSFLLLLGFIFVFSQKANTDGQKDRAFWVKTLDKIARPVVFNLADGTLKKNMPVEIAAGADLANRKKVTYLEAVGRTLAGVAPWLTIPNDGSEESKLRELYKSKILQGLKNGVDRQNPDFLNFKEENQPIVDAAYLALAFLRAPDELWKPLDQQTKERYIAAFKSLRNRTGPYNNWVLFAGLNEAFLMNVGTEYDPARIQIAQEKITEWYRGDGWYSDGPSFSMDYYNSFVIHPMFVEFEKILLKFKRIKQADYDLAVKRMARYSEFLDRIIASDGTYPPLGRSITYRTAVFQALGATTVLHQLPKGIEPAQVRSALTAVFHRMFDGNQNFDEKGWLVLGFNGHQPNIADVYTSTGSLYMATLGFLSLGLPVTDPFWTDPPMDWTAKKAWSGKAFKKDYHVDY